MFAVGLEDEDPRVVHGRVPVPAVHHRRASVSAGTVEIPQFEADEREGLMGGIDPGRHLEQVLVDPAGLHEAPGAHRQSPGGHQQGHVVRCAAQGGGGEVPGGAPAADLGQDHHGGGRGGGRGLRMGSRPQGRAGGVVGGVEARQGRGGVEQGHGALEVAGRAHDVGPSSLAIPGGDGRPPAQQPVLGGAGGREGGAGLG